MALTKGLKVTLIATAITAVSACGGEGTTDNTNNLTTNTPDTTAGTETDEDAAKSTSLYDFETPEYTLDTLEAEDATNVAKALIWSLQEYITPDSGYQQGYGATYIHDYNQEIGDFEHEIVCSAGGTKTGISTITSKYVTSNGDRILATGDSATIRYDDCISNADINYTTNGSKTTTTITGKVSDNNFRDPDSVQRLTYNKLAHHYGNLAAANYLHGALEISLDDNSRTVSGTYLARRATLERKDLNEAGTSVLTQVIEQSETVLSNFDFDISYSSDFGDSENPIASMMGNATIGNSFLDSAVDITITEALTQGKVSIGEKSLSTLTGGTVLAKGSSGELSVSFFDDYFAWTYGGSTQTTYWSDIYPQLQ